MSEILKDFDGWNVVKKKIDQEGENKFYNPRDIWWCSMGVNIGVESDGKKEEYSRPVLVLKGFNKESFLGVALTGKKKEGKYYIPLGMIEDREASANLSQIRLFDTKRLMNRVGMLDETIFELIKKAIKDLL